MIENRDEHAWCLPSVSLPSNATPCMLGSPTLATCRCRAATVFTYLLTYYVAVLDRAGGVRRRAGSGPLWGTATRPRASRVRDRQRRVIRRIDVNEPPRAVCGSYPSSLPSASWPRDSNITNCGAACEHRLARAPVREHKARAP